jgi:hypothetical protein
MCRNITMLRGLEPPATAEETTAAALQYVRKVGGIQKPTAATEAAIDRAVRRVAEATADLLSELPPRRQPPPTLPPMRRREGTHAHAHEHEHAAAHTAPAITDPQVADDRMR